MQVCVTNESSGIIIAPRAKVAASLGERLRGLLGTTSLSVGEGLWITPCHSVHTFFMKYPIDLLFLDKKGVVVLATTLAPWRLSAWKPQAAGVLELAAGAINRTKTKVGDSLTLRTI